MSLIFKIIFFLTLLVACFEKSPDSVTNKNNLYQNSNLQKEESIIEANSKKSNESNKSILLKKSELEESNDKNTNRKVNYCPEYEKFLNKNNSTQTSPFDPSNNTPNTEIKTNSNGNNITEKKYYALKVFYLKKSDTAEILKYVAKILNHDGYIFNNKEVNLVAKKTEKISRKKNNFAPGTLESLKKQIEEHFFESYPGEDISKYIVNTKEQLLVKSTIEKIIAHENGYVKIVLNFANENHAGGNPGLYVLYDKDDIKKIESNGKSASVQEESLCRYTTLFKSLIQISPRIDVKDNRWNYYCDSYNKRISLDSENNCFISENNLFLKQKSDDPNIVEFLDTPQNFYVITSAAKNQEDKNKNSYDKESMYKRIEMVLLTAVLKVIELKKNDPNVKVELSLGAFGCGVFAPEDSKDNNFYYSDFVAEIFKNCFGEILLKYFDSIIHPVPVFGKDANNFKAFKKYFKENEKYFE